MHVFTCTGAGTERCGECEERCIRAGGRWGRCRILHSFPDQTCQHEAMQIFASNLVGTGLSCPIMQVGPGLGQGDKCPCTPKGPARVIMSFIGYSRAHAGDAALAWGSLGGIQLSIILVPQDSFL